MRTRPAVAVAVLGVLAVAHAGAGAHGNHVAVGDQVSADGTVVVEATQPLTGAFLMLHADGDGPGEPIGHSSKLAPNQPRVGVPVSMAPDAWADWPDRGPVWVVLHGDDGDGEFDPETDEPLRNRGELAAERISLRKGRASAHLIAPSLTVRSPSNGSVAIERVAMPEDGSDPVVTVIGLRAGEHRSVAVELDRSFLARQPNTFQLRAVLYADDGDGTFDDADSPVTVDGDAVSTTFLVGRPSGVATPTTDGGSTVETPTITETLPPTAAGAGSTTERTADSTTTGDDRTAETDGGAGPGPGVVGAVLAVLLVAGLLAARRRRR